MRLRSRPAPASVEVDPCGAEAWIAYIGRAAGLLREPEPVPDPRTLADPVQALRAARTLAMRAGAFNASQPATGP